MSDINEKLEARKHYEEALEIGRRLAQKNPWTYELFVTTILDNLGVLMCDINEKQEARKYYKEALDRSNTFLQLIENVLGIDPSKGEVRKLYTAYNGIASWCALHTRQAKNAEEYARKALEIDPSASWANTHLAHSLLLQGRYSEAEELYRYIKSQPYEEDTSRAYGEVLLDDLYQLACSGAIPPEHQAEVERIKPLLME